MKNLLILILSISILTNLNSQWAKHTFPDLIIKNGNSDFGISSFLDSKFIITDYSKDVYFSYDEGKIWNKISFPVQISDVLITSKKIYVTTGIEYFSSIDSGKTFIKESVSTSQNYWCNLDEDIYLSSFNDGLYKFNNIKNLWSSIYKKGAMIGKVAAAKDRIYINYDSTSTTYIETSNDGGVSWNKTNVFNQKLRNVQKVANKY
jgi:hypothetical protein